MLRVGECSLTSSSGATSSKAPSRVRLPYSGSMESDELSLLARCQVTVLRITDEQSRRPNSKPNEAQRSLPLNLKTNYEWVSVLKKCLKREKSLKIYI